MSTTVVDIEDVEATKSEKLLAVVLAAFLLIGGIWAYAKIDDYARDAVDAPALSAEQRADIRRNEKAQARAADAVDAEASARDNLELKREAYRTALDAGRRAPGLEQQYKAAQAGQAAAQARVALTRSDAAAAQAAATDAYAADRDRYEREYRRESLASFAGRFVLAVVSLLCAVALLNRLRRQQSRWLVLGLAAVGTAAVLGFVLAADYVTDYIDPLDLGPLVLSVFGVAVTVAAFWSLQRYLARRLPARRAGKSECPFCGHPVRGHGPHCEGCGRRVFAACPACSEPRRVGVAHCATCGATG